MEEKPRIKFDELKTLEEKLQYMIDVNQLLVNENLVFQSDLKEVIKSRDKYSQLLHEVRCENDKLKHENMKYEGQNVLFQDLLRHFIDNI